MLGLQNALVSTVNEGDSRNSTRYAFEKRMNMRNGQYLASNIDGFRSRSWCTARRATVLLQSSPSLSETTRELWFRFRKGCHEFPAESAGAVSNERELTQGGRKLFEGG